MARCRAVGRTLSRSTGHAQRPHSLSPDGEVVRHQRLGRRLLLMTQLDPQNSGRGLRRKVRRVTIGVVGAAALASAAVTAGLAYAANQGPTTATASSESSTSSTGSSEEAGDDAAITQPTQTPAALAPAAQAPALSSGGGAHAQSGGS